MKNGKKFIIFVCAISLTLLSITIYRAFTTNITYDEAYTYLNYVYKNPFRVFSHIFKNGTLANNHLLNSFLISFNKTILQINYNEFLIRIPNIISYVVYIVFCYLFTKDEKYKYAYFSALTLNYGANEFFGLARGYGIACSFVLVGLYMFKKYINNINKSKYLTFTYLFLLIACYANTVALIPFGSVIITSFIILIKNKDFWGYTKKQVIPLIFIVTLSLLIVKYHFMISEDGLPLYGGKTTFYNDVLVSYLSVYGFSLEYINYVANILCITIYTIIILNLKKIKNNYLFISGIIYFILLISITIITNNMWTTGRCLIPSMPLIIIMIFEVIQTLNLNKYIINILTVGMLAITFANNVDLKKTREWNYSIKSICYEAYIKQDNTIIELVKEDYAVNFYQKKILKEKNYDIYK